MEQLVSQISSINILSHIWLTLFILVTMVLVSRTIVAGTRYSSILIIVVFGLSMGLVLTKSGLATPGLAEFPVVGLMSGVTVTVLISTFFVGGQEIKKLFTNQDYHTDDILVESDEEVVLGTRRTQLVYIVRSFFILLGIEGIYRILMGYPTDGPLGNSYLLLAYIGIVGSIVLIDYKAKISNKQLYIRKGLTEIILILAILIASSFVAQWIKPIIGLPQIFFAMMISAGLGAIFSNWKFGPTFRALLFAGIPIILASTFLIGGSRMLEAFKLSGMTSVIAYGFFGQIFWMFGGLTILIFLCRANNVRNLAPGMAGALSHSGLTGACTAGDLGKDAASRAPIMINIPFFGHIFVFSILAASAAKGQLMYGWVLPLILVGVVLVVVSIRTLREANGKDAVEVKGLMQFAFGWQIVAVFGGFTLLSLSGMPIGYAAMANSSALSHFGLFAAVQGGMFGDNAAALISFIFAMPFLVHPLVFGIFGKAASNKGVMPAKTVFTLFLISVIGIIAALTVM